MKIAHVSDCYLPKLGGIEIQVHDLALEQTRDGHDVRILTCTPEGSRLSSAGEVPVSRLPGGLPWRLPLMPATRQSRDAVREGGFDAIHVHSSVVSPFSWSTVETAAALAIPTVVTMHSVLPARPQLLGLTDRLGSWSQWPVVWTAVSEVAATPLRQVLGTDAVGVLPNGIDPAAWHTPSPRSPDAPLTIVSVMRLSQRKRPMALLGTLARIRKLIPASTPIRAVLIGDGPQQWRMERFLRTSGMRSWVTLTGRLTRAQIRPLLSAADVYLAPAQRESFGIAALEARCAGLPVVAMAKGGVGEFIRDGVEGFLVHSDDEMIRATAELLLSPGLRAMQEHNRSSIPEMTWPRVVARSLDLYRQAGASVPLARQTVDVTQAAVGQSDHRTGAGRLGSTPTRGEQCAS